MSIETAGIDIKTRKGYETGISGRKVSATDGDFRRLQNSRELDDEEPGLRDSRKPCIVIIHSRTVFRDCLAQCLEMAYVDHEVFSFASIGEWFACGEPKALDVAVIIVVIDPLTDPRHAGLEILEANAVTNPVIVVSDTDDLNHIVRILKSGVRGYIPTSLSLNVAVEAVRLVTAGGVFIPASSIVPGDDEPMNAKDSSCLTQRQMEVVEEIRHGKANKQIAYELNMSEHTVKVHLRHIMRKLKARNRTEVAVLSGNLVAGHREPPKTAPTTRPERDAAEGDS